MNCSKQSPVIISARISKLYDPLKTKGAFTPVTNLHSGMTFQNMTRCSHLEASQTGGRYPLAACQHKVKKCSTFVVEARRTLTTFFLPANHIPFLVTWQDMLNNVVYLATHMFSW